jgi:hypothetical protein
MLVFIIFSASMLQGGVFDANEDISKFSLKITDLSLNYTRSFYPWMYEDAVQSEAVAESGRMKKKFGRASIELGVFLVYNGIRYTLSHSKWKPSVHKYKFNLKDQSKRIFNWKNWNYDTNCFTYNWLHAVAGAIYYNFARTNYLNKWESFLIVLANDIIWEFIVEHRSDISMNDHFFTAVGGIPIGEAWFQFGKYFNERTDTASKILGFLNPLMKFNRFLDRKKLKAIEPELDSGWHEFNVFLGGRNSRTSARDSNQYNLHFGVHTQLNSISDFMEHGQVSEGLSNTLFSEIYFDLTRGSSSITGEANIFTRAVYFGYHKRNINDQGRGYSYYLGLGSAFSYYNKKEEITYVVCNVKGRNLEPLHLEEPRNFSDKITAAHMLGPVFDFTYYSRKLRTRLILDAYFDFALVNPFALNPFSVDNDISGMKTTPLLHGYYYAFGTTLSSGLDFYFGRFVWKGFLKYQVYGSIDGKDRFQDEVTDDFHITDSKLNTRMSLSYQLPWRHVEVLASYEGLHRKGRIKELLHKKLETRFFFGLNFRF